MSQLALLETADSVLAARRPRRKRPPHPYADRASKTERGVRATWCRTCRAPILIGLDADVCFRRPSRRATPRDWITDEVEGVEGDETTKARVGIRRALTRLADDRRRDECPMCGVRLDAHTTDTLMVAMCPDCERVPGMRPRLLLTTRQAVERARRAALVDSQARVAGQVHKIAIIGRFLRLRGRIWYDRRYATRASHLVVILARYEPGLHQTALECTRVQPGHTASDNGECAAD